MMATGLLLIWCCAGITSLYRDGGALAKGPEGLTDHFFAAALGPFAFLISYLSYEMRLEPETEPDTRKDASIKRG